jgi:cell division septal protein FtsQ
MSERVARRPFRRRELREGQRVAETSPRGAHGGDRRIVVARDTTRLEQRTTIPRMRSGPDRQRSLRIETLLPKPPRALPPLPKLRLTTGPLTPARVGSMVLALAMVALASLFLMHDAFYIYSADVQGNRLVSAHDIYARSAIDGVNVFFIRAGEAERRLRDVPFVKNARFTLQLPARVRIDVEERSPAILWQVAGNTYGVADDGTVLPPEGAQSSAPVVQSQGESLQYGAKIDAELVALAAHVRDLIPDGQRIVFSRERGIGVVTTHGWPVYFGFKDDAIPSRVAVLNSLIARLKQDKVEPEFVDLRFSPRPYYRAKGEPAATAGSPAAGGAAKPPSGAGPP